MQIEPTALNATGGWQTDSLARSADHKWAVFAADQFYLYSSDSDSLTSVPVFTVDPINNLYGVRGYAINANGTKIPVASAAQVTFLDHSSPISWFDLHSRRISAFQNSSAWSCKTALSNFVPRAPDRLELAGNRTL